MSGISLIIVGSHILGSMLMVVVFDLRSRYCSQPVRIAEERMCKNEVQYSSVCDRSEIRKYSSFMN